MICGGAEKPAQVFLKLLLFVQLPVLCESVQDLHKITP